jgi:hypothetical protein
MDRKRFIDFFVRVFLLGMLVSLAGFMAGRGRVKPGVDCQPGAACEGCPERGNCMTSETEKTRNHGRI